MGRALGSVVFRRPRSVGSPWSDSIFRIDAQGVGYPVDVVEIGDHLNGVMDSPVVQTRCPEGREVSLFYFVGGAGHFFGECA